MSKQLGLALLLLPLMLRAANAWAAEEDIFDSDSFVDPRDIGTELVVHGDPNSDGKFSFSDLQAGYVANFFDRSLLTDSDAPLISLSHFQYRSDWQLGGKITALGGDVSGFRGGLVFGKYSLNTDKRGGDPFVGRWQAALTFDDFEGQPLETEIAVDSSVELPKSFGERARGGLTASYRFRDGPDTIRVQWKSSIDFKSWRRAVLNGAFFVGYERRDSRDRLAPIEGRLALYVNIARKMQLDVVAAPAYQFNGGGFDAGWHLSGYVGIHRIFSNDLDDPGR